MDRQMEIEEILGKVRADFDKLPDADIEEFELDDDEDDFDIRTVKEDEEF